jgi:hypothetical protein
MSYFAEKMTEIAKALLCAFGYHEYTEEWECAENGQIERYTCFCQNCKTIRDSKVYGA